MVGGKWVLEPQTRQAEGSGSYRTSLDNEPVWPMEDSGKRAASVGDKPRLPPTLARLESQTLRRLSGASDPPPAPLSMTNTDYLVKPSWRRYIILILFTLSRANISYQWLQIPASTTKATVLYEVENYVINIASMLFMVVFILFSWPACLVIETIGPRQAVVWSTLGTAVGAAIKCFSCQPNGIWLMFLGQTLVALSELLLYPLPSRLASIWFPDSEVSLSVALCITGGQIGHAFGFILPHWFLQGLETHDEIAGGFYRMFLATFIYSAAILLICILLFANEPKFPPGLARLKQLECERELGDSQRDSLSENLARMLNQIIESFRSEQLMLLAASYGTIVGVGYTIETLIDQMLKQVWPSDDLVAGNAGFLIIIAGIPTTPIWGRAMDLWHAYKSINLIIASSLVLTMVLFTSAMVCLESTLFIYLAAILMGLFQGGFIASGLEYAVELTYPAPELVTSSVMILMPQAHSIVQIVIASYITDHHGVLAANIFLIALLLLGILLLLATRQTLKRQLAIASGPEMKTAS